MNSDSGGPKVGKHMGGVGEAKRSKSAMVNVSRVGLGMGQQGERHGEGETL